MAPPSPLNEMTPNVVKPSHRMVGGLHYVRLRSLTSAVAYFLLRR